VTRAVRDGRYVAGATDWRRQVGSMIEFFQITGSASFAARMALEEAGAEYEEVNIHPRRRDEPASFGEVNPLKRVPALRDGDVTVYETGAVLLYWPIDSRCWGRRSAHRSVRTCIAGSCGLPTRCIPLGGRS
jgi:glutathione S-transferase-like protein